MSKGAYDVFALAIIFWRSDWCPKHVTIDLFEATKTTWQGLAKSLTNLLDKHGLRKKIFAYVKDEGFHFNVKTIILKSIVSHESLGLEENFQGVCFGHFSKAC